MFDNAVLSKLSQQICEGFSPFLQHCLVQRDGEGEKCVQSWQMTDLSKVQAAAESF